MIRNGKDDAAVGVLEDVGVVVIETLVHDDVAALDEAQATRRQALLSQEGFSPRAGCVDESAAVDAAAEPPPASSSKGRTPA